MKPYDVVVVGLGIMGSASLWRLAQAGARVLGIEAGGPMHCNGSSHGATRIFRRAYFEGAAYLPLLNLAHAGWQQLQATTDQRLTTPTGGLFMGPKATGVVASSVRTAIAGGIEHTHLDTTALRERFPQFTVDDGMHAVLEPGAYALASETVRLQMLTEAVQLGAQIQYGAAVESVEHVAAGLTVTTKAAQRVGCKAAIVTSGAWITRQFPELAAHVEPRRVPIYWFAPRSGLERQFGCEALLVFLYECSDGSLVYGIPAGTSTEPGVKIGFHNKQQQPCDPASDAPAIGPDLRREIGSYVAKLLPGLLPEPTHAKWCIYTVSRDESFLMGPCERIPGVFYASACSGHGFKFAPAIGSVLASLALDTAAPVAIEPFLSSRFA